MLHPYRDVIMFMIALLVSNYFWKFTVQGEESGVGSVTWFGLDLTNIFNAYAAHIANAVFSIVSSVRDTIYQVNAYTLRWINGVGTRIVWSCTPLKQSFIWICIMLSTPWVVKDERWKVVLKRVGWIVMGLVVIYAFNILRISLITLAMEHHPEWFHMLHEYVFKYLFYGMMFLMWVVYVEKVRGKS